jgi:5-(hydroxymethyl)furfural/furfural oxidase
VERDLDFADDNHGSEGCIAVRRIFPKDWNQHAKAAAEAFEELGYSYMPDQNSGFGDGYFPLVHANQNESRISAATSYLDPETRQRPNLTIRTETHVIGLVFDGKCCTGIKLLEGGREVTVRAREIVLSSGAIHSPAMLLRSGIGPSQHLQSFGICVTHHLAGVGRGLMDHPQIALGSYLKPHARMNGNTGRHILVGLRYSSDAKDAPRGDMFLGCLSRTAWHDVGKQFGSFVVWVNKSFSRDGEVKLASEDWRQEPDVDFRLLSDRRDMERLKQGFHLMASLQMTAAMREVTESPFPACYTDRARQVGVVNTKNRILTSAMARLLDGPAALRETLMRRFIMSGHDLQTCLTDESALETFIYDAVAGIWHASCSCRMGERSNPMAVTDTDGRVHGIGGLRICDASIFPSVPSANTNFPTFMVAEKISDAILAE